MEITELQETLSAYRVALQAPVAGIENGLGLLREKLEQLSLNGFTRGHLHRKVE